MEEYNPGLIISQYFFLFLSIQCRISVPRDRESADAVKTDTITWNGNLASQTAILRRVSLDSLR